ncbi:unnamed protein product [Spirodela intermedia]|uniref:Uncharacterized protein n=1 Tax=Spirodela intermedia TaxID=51605 RepID=A0ABN7ED17_SPIIN|nr:unnamed protein product [Spirodela intermedia]
MATAGRPAAAAAFLVLFAVALIAPASASTLTVSSGPGCSGRSMDINGCALFREQEAVLYTDRHCRNRYRSQLLDEETRYCRRFPFRSVEMVC